MTFGAKMMRGRRALLLGILVLAGALFTLFWFRETGASAAEKAVDRSTEILHFDGYSLAVRDYGTGSPTVVIEPGVACTMHLYSQLQFDLGKKTRVISYDHPGIGRSTPNDTPRTIPHHVEELRALLARKKVEPPYILVGHSLGGHTIRYFTKHHPDEVMGMVFIDHPHEDWFRHVRATWAPEDQKKYFDWWSVGGPQYKGTALTELVSYEENCDLVRGILPPPDMPVLMFTGNAHHHYNPDAKDQDRKLWADMQASLLRNVREKKHIIDWETGHVPHRQKPDLFAREISEFIDRAREKRGAGQAP